MKTTSVLILTLALASCAQMTKKHNGYSSSDLRAKKDQLDGKNPKQLKEILGEPVAEGICNDGKSYKMVYLKETMPNYSFALSMSNKSKLNCTLIEMGKDKEGEFKYRAVLGGMDQTMCSESYGAINRVRACKKIKKN